MATYTGTTGNDNYIGVAGVADTAVIGATLASATFSFDGLRWNLLSSAGTDTLASIETAQFSDASIKLVAAYGATVANSLTYGLQSSDVTVLANGSYVVAWHSSAGDGGDLTFQRYTATGEKLGAETTAVAASSQTTPSIAALADGGWVMAWQTAATYNDPDYGPQPTVDIRSQRYDASGNKVGSEVTVTSTLTSELQPQVTGLSNGGYVVSWGQSDYPDYPGYTTFAAQVYTAAGAPVGSKLTLDTGLSGVGTVTAVGTGFVVTWVGSNAGWTLNHTRVSATGTVLSSDEIALNTYSARSFDVASGALADGSYVLAYQRYDGAGTDVYVQRYSAAGAKLGAEILVKADVQVPADDDQPIDVVGLKGGGFVVVYSGHDYVNSQGLHAQVYDASGVAVGEPTHFASYYSIEPDLAASADGGFVVSWSYSSQVYTQKFDADGLPAALEMIGTTGANTLRFEGNQRIKLIGDAGNDLLVSGGGADLLDGGTGNDTMSGGGGNDLYVWQSGDVIEEFYGGGIDTVRTATTYTLTSRYLENAELTGSAKADLIGNGANNRLKGNSADNVLNGGGGADQLIGGLGNDTYVVDHVSDSIVEASGAGTDAVLSSVSLTLGANLEWLRLTGGASIDGTGNTLSNLITGNAYANRLYGASGADTLIGGLGDDTYVLDAASIHAYTEYAGEGSDTIEIDRTWVLNSALDSVENLTLREGGAYNGTGDGIANRLRGNSSNNRLDGGAGADNMDGGGGNDTYIVDNASDVASEAFGWGHDHTYSSVSHTLGSGVDDLTLTGTAGNSGTGNVLNNRITGNSGANVLQGLDGADTVIGGAGNDTLRSFDGLDMLYGSSGNDSYAVVGDGDEVVERLNEGTDTVTATITTAYTLTENVENLTLVGTHVDGHGNTLANVITGTSGDNLLDGGGGVDRLVGKTGNDTYLVDNVADVVVEDLAAGIDEIVSTVTLTLAANVERLTLGGIGAISGTGNTLSNRLIGNDAVNTLRGLGGNDVLLGYGGSDVLEGGDGNDTMTGGAGNDSFRFVSALASSNVDRIVDFSAVADTIQIDNAVFKAFVATGAISSANLRAGAGVTTAADANDYLLYNATSGALYYDADGSGTASAAVLFATLSAGLTLTSADFVVI